MDERNAPVEKNAILTPVTHHLNEDLLMERAMGKSSISDCLLVELPQIADPRGNLTFIESRRHLPFDIHRVYYLYDVPGGSHRGGHAHRQLQEFLIAISGSFDIQLDDGTAKTKISLNRSYFGLHIVPLIWREIDNFSSGAVCLVLASAHYSEADYIRDYREFIASIAGQDEYR